MADGPSSFAVVRRAIEIQIGDVDLDAPRRSDPSLSPCRYPVQHPLQQRFCSRTDTSCLLSAKVGKICLLGTVPRIHHLTQDGSVSSLTGNSISVGRTESSPGESGETRGRGRRNREGVGTFNSPGNRWHPVILDDFQMRFSHKIVRTHRSVNLICGRRAVPQSSRQKQMASANPPCFCVPSAGRILRALAWLRAALSDTIRRT